MNGDDRHLLIEVLTEGRTLGFLGPGDVENHLDHARAFVDLIGPADSVLDLGSGGGVPGLVIAMSRPDGSVTLLDAGDRRAVFLRDAVERLGLAATVVHGRAEELARRPDLRHRFDVVTARSFGAPAVTAECAAGFLTASGRLLVSEPPDGNDRWPTDGCDRLGLRPAALETEAGARIQVLEVERLCSDDVPRRNGVPSRRPLW